MNHNGRGTGRHLARWAATHPRAARGAGAALVMTVLALLLGAWSRGFDATVVVMSPGTVWLTSADRGELTLLDATTPAVVRHLPMSAPGAALAVQQGPPAFGLDGSTGALSRIDARTFELVTEPHALTRASTRPVLASAGPGLYVVDAVEGVATRVDAASLHPLDSVDLRIRPPEGGVAVDGTGRAWLTDATSRDVAWLGDGTTGRFPDAAAAPGALVGVVRDGPVLVSTASGTVDQLDARGAITRTARLPLHDGDRIAVAGDGDNAVDIAASTSGVLVRCVMTRATCTQPIPLRTGTDVLGSPVAIDGLVFVPDHTDGRVIIVDPERGVVVAAPGALRRPAAFELFAHDGFVVFNDPAGPDAGVVDPDGTVHLVDKHARTAADSSPAGPSMSSPPDEATIPPAAPEVGTAVPTTTSAPSRTPDPPTSTSRPTSDRPPTADAQVVLTPTTPPTAAPTGARPSTPSTSGRPAAELAATTGPPSSIAPTGTGPSATTSNPPGPDDDADDPSTLRNDRFDQGAGGWPSDSVDGGDYGPVADFYRVRSIVPGFAVWAPGPVRNLPGAIRITATARLGAGSQGGWGVWAQAPGDTGRYEFSVSHTGTAYLKEPGSDEMLGVQVDGLDPYDDNTIVAEIRPDGGEVLMTMSVNGVQVAQAGGEHASPAAGQVGMHAFSYGDLDGLPLGDARLSAFRLEAL